MSDHSGSRPQPKKPGDKSSQQKKPEDKSSQPRRLSTPRLSIPSSSNTPKVPVVGRKHSASSSHKSEVNRRRGSSGAKAEHPNRGHRNNNERRESSSPGTNNSPVGSNPHHFKKHHMMKKGHPKNTHNFVNVTVGKTKNHEDGRWHHKNISDLAKYQTSGSDEYNVNSDKRFLTRDKIPFQKSTVSPARSPTSSREFSLSVVQSDKNIRGFKSSPEVGKFGPSPPEEPGNVGIAKAFLEEAKIHKSRRLLKNRRSTPHSLMSHTTLLLSKADIPEGLELFQSMDDEMVYEGDKGGRNKEKSKICNFWICAFFREFKKFCKDNPNFYRITPNHPLVCPRCRIGTFKAEWTPLSIFCCVCVPIVGIPCYFSFREYTCTECGEIWEYNDPREELDAMPVADI